MKSGRGEEYLRVGAAAALNEGFSLPIDRHEDNNYYIDSECSCSSPASCIPLIAVSGPGK
jgi:hypothetical protein